MPSPDDTSNLKPTHFAMNVFGCGVERAAPVFPIAQATAASDPKNFIFRDEKTSTQSTEGVRKHVWKHAHTTASR